MFDDTITPASISPAGTRAATVKPSRLEDEVVSLFDQLRAKLLRYLLSLGLPASDGEEIVQEVFLALFQHLQRGKSRDNLRAWVFQVAHNLGLKQRHSARREREAHRERADRGAASQDLLVDLAPNPEDRLAASQRQERLLAVLWALPDQDRRCISLRAEGLTYREIATVLDISLGSVSLYLTRSLARFACAVDR
jgi:RNA polymerase sigma-70 factor (ECF subfamily)